MAYGIVFYFSPNTWGGKVKYEAGDARNGYNSAAHLTVFPGPKDATTEELQSQRRKYNRRAQVG